MAKLLNWLILDSVLVMGLVQKVGAIIQTFRTSAMPVHQQMQQIGSKDKEES